jgi:hypothetical protein
MGLCPVEVSGPIAVSYLYARFEAKKSAIVNPARARMRALRA